MTYTISFLMLAAGLLHFIATPERYHTGAALGIFFILLGIAQISYAYYILRTPNKKVMQVGVIFNTGLLLLWLLTQILPHVAGSSREPITAISIIRKALELITVELLIIRIKQAGMLSKHE